MKEATSISWLLTSAAAWLFRWRCMDSWVPKLSESSGLAHEGSEVVSGDPQLSCRWKASQSGNSTPSHWSTARNVIHTHTRYTHTNISSIHFCPKTPNNPLGVCMNNVEYSFTHYKTNSHNIWRNWEIKHKQGKEVVKSIATDMTGTVWSHDITLLFAVFLYIEQISVESNNKTAQQMKSKRL